MDKQELPARSQVLEPVRTGDDYSMDTKSHLQEHWIWYWIDKLFEREEENVQLKSKLHHLQLVRDTYQKCLEELREENMALKTAQGKSVEESAHLRWELEQLSEDMRSVIVSPYTLGSATCIHTTLRLAQRAHSAISESRLQRRELEEENQQLRKQIEDFRVQMEREKQTSQVLETLCEELVEEREQLLRDKKTLNAERAQQFKDMKKLVHSLRDSSQTSSKAPMKGRKTEQKVLLQTVTDTKRKVTMMEWERRQLCRDLEQVKAQAAQAQELEHMKVRVKEQVVRAQKLEQELHRLQEEIEKLAMEVSTLTTAPERVHALEWESQDLLLENQRLQTSLDTLQPEGLERDKQLDTRQVENSTLRSQSASHTALTEQDSQLQHQQLVAAHQALQQEHASLGALHEHLTKEHKALLDKYRRHKKLLHQILELESKALSDSYKDQIQHKVALDQLGMLLTTEQEALQQEQRTSAMAAEENQRLQRELDRANFLHQQLKGEQEELQSHTKKLQTSLNDMQLEVHHWKARYEELKGEQEEMYTVTKKLQTQVNELLTDNKELLTDNEELHNEELRTDNKELRTDKEELLTDCKELRTENKELLTDNKELLTYNEELLADNEELLTDCKELRTDNEELRTDNKVLRTENKELRKDNKQLLTDYKELRTDYKELQMSLKDMQQGVNHWQGQYEELKGEQEEMYTVTKKLQAHVKELLTDKKELLTDYKELKMSLKDTQREVNHWQGQYEGLKAEQEALYAHTKELQTHTKELLTENQELQTTLKEMQQEVTRWQGRYKELKGEQEDLQMHNKKLQTSLNDTQLEVNCWRNQCNWLREELQRSGRCMETAKYRCISVLLAEHSALCVISFNSRNDLLLSHLKGNLEGENRHLQSQIQSLTEKNQRLHLEDVENNYQHQEEQRQYV
ncbi:protein Daple-like [Myotis yumanensis]|uniref:protein Daple-like n=1 Tax=Myotis yumanensis TaxID=159337 RepID=UPI0038D4234E